MNDTTDAEVFCYAIERLEIKTTDAPRLFSVTRQTLSSWIHGKSKIPKAAFVVLLAMENEAYQRTQARVEDIARTARTIAEITASREKGNTGTQQEKAGGQVRKTSE